MCASQHMFIATMNSFTTIKEWSTNGGEEPLQFCGSLVRDCNAQSATTFPMPTDLNLQRHVQVSTYNAFG